MRQDEAHEFLLEAYKHCKAIASSGAGVDLLAAALAGQNRDEGVVVGGDASIGKMAAEFIKAVARHRHWERENSRQLGIGACG